MSEFDAINGYENTIDSRDIIARIEYLGVRWGGNGQTLYYSPEVLRKIKKR